MTDSVDHPSHYNQHSSHETIDIAEEYSFNLGNVIKYVMRAEYKGAQLEDLNKASWYLKREIKRLEKAKKAAKPQNPYPGVTIKVNGSPGLYGTITEAETILKTNRTPI